MQVKMILARDAKNLVGKQGRLPWAIKRDSRFFYDTTLGTIVIVGRKTADHLLELAKEKGQPDLLPGRKVIIVTTKDFVREYVSYGALTKPSFDQALELAKQLTTDEDSWWFGCAATVIGGPSIYRQALEKGVVDCVYLTTIHSEYEGDEYFDYDFTECFQSVDGLDEPAIGDNPPMTFQLYERKLSPAQ